jgi:hypothetical protein
MSGISPPTKEKMQILLDAVNSTGINGQIGG